MNHHRKVLAAAVGAGLGLSTLAVVGTATPAHAVTGVFISEIHYDNEGTDTGEFVEVTAPAGTDLSGFSVVLYNGNGGVIYDTDALSGVVPDQQDGWGTFVLDYPSNGIQNGDPDGLALVDGTAVVEFLSYEGTFQATDGPAAGQTSTDLGARELSSTPVGQSLQRQPDGSWAGPAASSKGTPNGHTVDGLPLDAQDPADVAGYVGVVMDDIELSASGGVAPYSWTVTGLPAGLSESEDGVISGTPTAAGTYEVTVTVSDSATPQGSDTETFTITVREVPTVAIADIQGTGTQSPLEGELVATEGVVTAVYRDPYRSVLGNSGGYDGFYLQTAGTGDASDETPGASDAVFVYTGNGLPAEVAIGDSYRVTGEVDEFAGTTEVVTQRSGLVELTEPLAAVTPLEIAYPRTTAGREAHEGELLAPTDELTVSNVYPTNQYAEIGLATGDEPLIQPTDVARPGTAEYRAVVADNRARAVTLDDATSVNFLDYGDVEQDIPLPWLSKSNPIRVGAKATLLQPVILEFRNSTWKFQPTEPVTGAGAGGDVASFENTRQQNQAPQDVGGDIRLATFNVLNYFNTTGEDFEAAGADCSYYTDRDGEPVAVNRCQPEGPRGAADAEDLARQQAKIVAAINGLDADIVSLEELENSVALGEADRDDAIKALVQALNAAAGPGTWSYVKSPDEAYDPATLAQQDVIRTGFIYRPEAVKPVGESDILFHPDFVNARQPLAQAFMPVAAPREKFAVVVNHFKSKGCSASATGDNADAGDGQSCFNGDRVRQARALAGFADEFAAARDITSVFLTGDFNAYTEEDPMHVLHEAGYGLVESDQEGDWSYSFQGHSGSLDHVLASATALDAVTGADVWEINANESIAFQYSRYNYNATDFYEPNQFAASDHNPEIVGVEVSGLR